MLDPSLLGPGPPPADFRYKYNVPVTPSQACKQTVARNPGSSLSLPAVRLDSASVQASVKYYVTVPVAHELDAVTV